MAAGFHLCRSLAPMTFVLMAVPALAAGPTVVRIIQTNAAGDNAHVIDPLTNKVVGVIEDIEVPHGVTSAPDGSRIYITNESLRTMDAVDAEDAEGGETGPAQRPTEQHLRRRRTARRFTSASRRRQAPSMSSTLRP